MSHSSRAEGRKPQKRGFRCSLLLNPRLNLSMGLCFSQTRGSGASQPESKGGGGGRLGSAARASSRADTARAADTCPACPGAGLLAAVSGSAVLRGLLRGPGGRVSVDGACRSWRRREGVGLVAVPSGPSRLPLLKGVPVLCPGSRTFHLCLCSLRMSCALGHQVQPVICHQQTGFRGAVAHSYRLILPRAQRSF